MLSDPRLGKGDAEFMQKTGWKLLPFLVITSADVGIPGSIARSAIFSQHPLTLSWAQGHRPTTSCGFFTIKASRILNVLFVISSQSCRM